MAKQVHPLVTKENFEIFQWALDPKVIDGALRSAIHAHGPITLGGVALYDADGDLVRTCSTSSAAKRIRGAVRTRMIEYFKKKSLTPRLRWYNRVVGQVRGSLTR